MYNESYKYKSANDFYSASVYTLNHMDEEKFVCFATFEEITISPKIGERDEGPAIQQQGKLNYSLRLYPRN